MSKLIKIIYVGKKPFAIDNVARSGKTWNGNGDIQEVSDTQAKLLLKYPDQWALADSSDQSFVDAPTSISVIDEFGEKVAIDTELFGQSIEKLSKPQLAAYAKNKWGKDLPATKNRKDMIDQIEEWERDLAAVVGVIE